MYRTFSTDRQAGVRPICRNLIGVALIALLAGCGGAAPQTGVSSTPDNSAAVEPSPRQSVAAAAVQPPIAPDETAPLEMADPPKARSIDATTVRTSESSTAAADAAFERLTNPDTSPADWDAAQMRLAELGPEAVPTLVRELQSGDPIHRELAASLLAVLGSDAAAAAEPLRLALVDESIYVRANAATALCALPDQAGVAFPALIQLLNSTDPQVRQMAAVNLGNFGEEAAPFVPQLTALLDEAPEDVMVPVVELLGRIGPQADAARPRLQQIAFEQEGAARAAATAALQQIGGGESATAE